MSLLKKLGYIYCKICPAPLIKPPFDYIVQLGDPILRTKCAKVQLEDIKTEKTKAIIEQLVYTMRLYKCVGLAAPQIGIDKRIFVMEFNKYHLSCYTNVQIERCEMTEIPLSVCINPEIKAVSTRKVTLEEGCESVKGYTADVSRLYDISLSALNENGIHFQKNFKGWPARIVQHELDHLNGTVYTDKMEKETFQSAYWREVNKYRGKIETRFYPS